MEIAISLYTYVAGSSSQSPLVPEILELSYIIKGSKLHHSRNILLSQKYGEDYDLVFAPAELLSLISGTHDIQS